MKSIKKIGTMVAVGVMAGSALASGAFAAEKVGDVDAFASDVITDGEANVEIVVGSDAAAQDVVSAANVAAKIGSLMFKEGSVEDGTAKITVSAEAESDELVIYEDGAADPVPDTVLGTTGEGSFVAGADADYTEEIVDVVTLFGTENDLEKLSTLSEVKDNNPEDWNDDDADNNAAEIITVSVEEITADGTDDDFEVTDDATMYLTATFDDSTNALMATEIGNRIPFMGEEMAVMDIDTDDDEIVLGKAAYSGVLKEGESYDIGNGYSVQIDSILINDDAYKADVKIVKDGKVVAETFESISDGEPLTMASGDVAVVVNDAWQNIGADYGYAEILIATDLVTLELGEEFAEDWEIQAMGTDGDLSDDISDLLADEVAGIAIVYTGDNEEISVGDEFEIADYVSFENEDDGVAKFKMDETKTVLLTAGQKETVLNAEIKLAEIEADAKESVTMTAPIAVLDTEIALDTADKDLILIGGPVANALVKELADAGLVAVDDETPATLAVIEGVANGNDVLVVAGGDRVATQEAAEVLIDLL